MTILEPHDVLISTFRWALGLSIGASVGLALAVLFSFIPTLGQLAKGLGGFLRALPILALVPAFQWSLGVTEEAKILLIGWATFFPVFLSTLGSVGRRLPDLELQIAVLKFSPWLRFRHYVFPRLIFGFLAGVEISVGIGWLTVVAAELIGTFNQGWYRGGLGHAVFVAFESGSFALGSLCLFIFGALGVTTAFAWGWVSRGIVWMLRLDRGYLGAS